MSFADKRKRPTEEMSVESEKPDIRKYLSDLQTVRDILTQHDERPLLEHWAFYSWGVVVLLGTVAHALLVRGGVELPADPALVVWLPAVILGGILESVSWVRQMKHEEVPIFGRRFVRFLLNFLGIGIAFFAVTIALYSAEALLPGILLVLAALWFTSYAQASFVQLFYEGYITLAAGLVLLVLGLDGFGAYVFAGLLTSAAFTATGIHSEVLSRGPRG